MMVRSELLGFPMKMIPDAEPPKLCDDLENGTALGGSNVKIPLEEKVGVDQYSSVISPPRVRALGRETFSGSGTKGRIAKSRQSLEKGKGELRDRFHRREKAAEFPTHPRNKSHRGAY
jgi:hypothetical protein